MIERRAIGVGQGDGDVGRMFLQSQPGPGERASGADRTGEAVQLPAGLRPDLRRGRADMGEAVCRVVELVGPERARRLFRRSEEHTSELQSLMRLSYAVFCLKKKTTNIHHTLEMND